MQKRRLLALVIGLMLSLNSYAQSDSETQSDSKGNYFFSIGFYNGIFSSGPVVPFPNFEIKMLRAGTIGGYYELPKGPGNAFFGLELGYSSGSYFGGAGGVDFIPFGVQGAYVFPIANILYIGPRLKIGGIGLLGPDWGKVVLTAGARLEAELRSTSFPVGLYVAGGIDVFPTSPAFATLPSVEVGLRYPRGKLKKSGSSDDSKNNGQSSTGSKDNSSGQSGVPASAVTPAESTPATTTTDPATQTPAATAPATTAPAAQTPATTAPAAQTPATTAPATTAPVAQTPAAPAPVTPAPAPVAPAPSTPAPTAQAQVVPPAIPAPATTAPVIGSEQGRSITLEDGRQGILNSIYFEPDTAVLIETYRPILESVGRQLAADPSLKLLIRAYAADFGTADGRYIVSVNRARFSRDYLTAQYGISSNRFINIEAFGADKSPIYATSDWQSYRCVELILLRD
jgi:outer membrane protein OmpA-like peptidoglycan-associated protein